MEKSKSTMQQHCNSSKNGFQSSLQIQAAYDLSESGVAMVLPFRAFSHAGIPDPYPRISQRHCFESTVTSSCKSASNRLHNHLLVRILIRSKAEEISNVINSVVAMLTT